MKKGKPQFVLKTVPITKGKKAEGRVRGRGRFKELPTIKKAMNEDKVRHIEDNREGRAGLSLCGCVLHKEWGREPLDPTASDNLDYLIQKLRGCQKCLEIWIKRFL